MFRAIGAVVVGYLSMAILIFFAFGMAYVGMGVRGAFETGSYNVTSTWIVTSFVLSCAAALIGGVVCRSISKSAKPVVALVAVVLLLGLGAAVATQRRGGDPDETEVRPPNVNMFEAMTKAKEPPWVSFSNPLVGAVGILLGARMAKKK